MSNTSTVTPYEEQANSGPSAASIVAGATVAGIAGAAVGAVALAKWLAEETEEDRVAVQRAEADNRQWMVAQATTRRTATRVESVGLCLREYATLLRSASRLGFEMRAPSAEMAAGTRLTLLSNAAGERLAMERTAEDRIVLHAASSRAPIEKLVRQHTFDRVEEHLKRSGMSVQAKRLANGEIQVLGSRSPTATGGAAEVRTQVRTDGTAWVDIEKVRGQECQTILSGIACAIGGRVLSCSLKPAFYEQPGEPTKAREKVRP